MNVSLYSRKLNDLNLTLNDVIRLIDERVGILLENDFDNYFTTIQDARETLKCEDYKIRSLMSRRKIRSKKIGNTFILWKSDIMEIQLMIAEGQNLKDI